MTWQIGTKLNWGVGQHEYAVCQWWIPHFWPKLELVQSTCIEKETKAQ